MSNLFENPRRSFEAFRWMSLIAVAAFPFTLSHGWISIGQLTGAFLVGLLWSSLTFIAWRIRSQLLLILSYIALIFAPKWFGLWSASSPTAHALQWLSIVVMVIGLPLLFARSFFMRLARLDSFPAPYSHADR
jgi:predicted ferric reductase